MGFSLPSPLIFDLTFEALSNFSFKYHEIKHDLKESADGRADLIKVVLTFHLRLGCLHCIKLLFWGKSKL